MAQARRALGQQGGVSGSQSISLLSQLDTGARSAKPGVQGAAAGPGEAGPGSGAGPVLQFFTRLRRHASLDGASPYFKVKKWKLEPSQRASSLDTRGELQPLVGSEAQGDVEQQVALHRRGGWGGGPQSPPQTGHHHLLTSGHLAHKLVRRMTGAAHSEPVKPGLVQLERTTVSFSLEASYSVSGAVVS